MGLKKTYYIDFSLSLKFFKSHIIIDRSLVTSNRGDTGVTPHPLRANKIIKRCHNNGPIDHFLPGQPAGPGTASELLTLTLTETKRRPEPGPEA